MEKLHNEELNDLYVSPNIVRVIKSRKIRWAGHIWHVWGEERCIFLVGKPEGKNYLEDPGTDGRIILRCIFRKCDVVVRTGLLWLRIGTVVSVGKCGNEPSGFIKCR